MSITDTHPIRLCFSRPATSITPSRDSLKRFLPDFSSVIQKAWKNLPPLKARDPFTSKDFQLKGQERFTIREIVGDQPNWHQALEKNVATWIKTRDYEMLFKASHILIGFCGEPLLFFLSQENEMGENALFHQTSIPFYLNLVETLAKENPDFLFRLLLKKNKTGATALEKLLFVGHPALRVLGLRLPKQMSDCLRGAARLLTEDGKSVLSKVFSYYDADGASPRVQLEMENIFQGLKAISPFLGDLYLIQKELFKGDFQEIEPILQRFSQGHILWLDVLPDLKDPLVERISSRLSGAASAKIENIQDWTFFFSEPTIHTFVQQQKRTLNITEILRCQDFLERLSKLPAIDFWIIGSCGNPIVHEIMGYIVDQLSYMQMKTYLKALDQTSLGFFLGSLQPTNFERVFSNFSLRLWDYYKKKHQNYFFANRYDLSEKTLLGLENKIKENGTEAQILVAGWILPGLKDFSNWLKALQNLPQHIKGRFSVLMEALEIKIQRYSKISDDAKVLGEHESFPHLCRLNQEPVMHPVKFHANIRDKIEIYDKTNILSLRPLVNPITKENFSYFDLEPDGNIAYLLREIEKVFLPKYPRGAASRATKAGCSEEGLGS